MVLVLWHIVYWDAWPARASASVSLILPWTDSQDSDHRLHIGPQARWPCPVAAARYRATAALAAQHEVFLAGTARTRQCFGESDPARDRDSGLYSLNGLPARWPCPIAAARYGATAVGAAKLEVVLSGTVRTRQCFG